jgi:hypothetical protein
MHPGASHGSDGKLWEGLKASNFRAKNTLGRSTEYDLLYRSRHPLLSMKLLPALVIAGLLASLGTTPAAEPSKESEREQAQIFALAKEVQAQQAAIAENQTKIDAKMVTVAEALRLAKIYASRGGR